MRFVRAPARQDAHAVRSYRLRVPSWIQYREKHSEVESELCRILRFSESWTETQAPEDPRPPVQYAPDSGTITQLFVDELEFSAKREGGVIVAGASQCRVQHVSLVPLDIPHSPRPSLVTGV